MQDLFLPSTAENIISRIEKLTPATKALWGKMNVAQMLAHLQVPLQVALNEKKLKRSLVGLLFGKVAKKKLIGEKPFARNLSTDRSFVITDPRNFEEEKQKLITLVKKFSNAGREGMSKEPHPFFGKMAPEEWSLI